MSTVHLNALFPQSWVDADAPPIDEVVGFLRDQPGLEIVGLPTARERGSLRGLSVACELRTMQKLFKAVPVVLQAGIRDPLQPFAPPTPLTWLGAAANLVDPTQRRPHLAPGDTRPPALRGRTREQEQSPGLAARLAARRRIHDRQGGESRRGRLWTRPPRPRASQGASRKPRQARPSGVRG